MPGTFEPPARAVLPLDALRAGMLAEAGGKAANLGEMLAAGFDVPAGFCVLASVYREALASAGAQELAEAVDAADDDGLRRTLAARLRDVVVAAEIPAPAAAAVLAAYEDLGAPAVAVRSSATAEDLPGASFAGQQETFLNVLGGHAVLDAVRGCWASLWTDRAVAYRRTVGFRGAEAALAVVVQPLVEASVAGVLFTADPVTGTRSRMVVDASPGLGEAVVSGAVDPDRFVVDSATGALLESRAGGKAVLVRPRAGGGTERVVRSEDDGGLCVSPEDVARLAGLGRRLEAHFGVPQDIEWALAQDGRLWLTQTRPITTLHPIPAGPSPAGPGTRIWFCFTLAQGLTRPVTPLGIACMRLLASSGARHLGFALAQPEEGPPVLGTAAGRVFLDITDVVRSAAGRQIAPRVLRVMEARSSPLLERLAEDPRFPLTRRSPARLIRRVGAVALRFRVPAAFVRALLRPEAALAGIETFSRALSARTAWPALAEDDTRGRLERARRILAEDTFPILPLTLPVAGAGFFCLGLAEWLLRGTARPGELHDVLRALPNNATTLMDEQLRLLAARVRREAPESAEAPDSAETLAQLSPEDLARRYAEGRLPAVLAEGLAAFLAQFGHRGVAEIDVGVPRWGEDPAAVLAMLAPLLRTATDDGAFAAAAARAEATARGLAGRAGARSQLRGKAVAALLSRVRLLAGLREQPKFFLIVAFTAARRDLAAVGRRLAQRGVLAEPDDVFFLDFAEARAALDAADGGGGEATGGEAPGARFRGLVTARRAEYAREMRRRRIPRILLSDGTEAEALGEPPPSAATQTADAGRVLRGVPASAGSLRGTARVVLDPSRAAIAPGEVLVAPSTDPGWTPLFLTAGALVMEMGGVNSHGAVVAREYGLPAVVGVPEATARIASGDLVEVDGAAGTVRIL